MPPKKKGNKKTSADDDDDALLEKAIAAAEGARTNMERIARKALPNGSDSREDGSNHALSKLLTRTLVTLTAENYDALSQELLGSTLPNMCTVCQQHPKALCDSVNKFFFAVVNETINPTLCARLCYDVVTHWAQQQSPEAETPPFGAQFRRQLLDKCQAEYERGVNLQKEIELLPTAEKEVQESTLRNRTLANIRFVGELYKKKFITERVMHQMIFPLLFPSSPKQITDEGLDLFCELMVTVGKELDKPRAQQFMQQYFMKLTLLSSTYTTPRVCVKLQSLLDLWKNNWVREDVLSTSTA